MFVDNNENEGNYLREVIHHNPSEHINDHVKEDLHHADFNKMKFDFGVQEEYDYSHQKADEFDHSN